MRAILMLFCAGAACLGQCREMDFRNMRVALPDRGPDDVPRFRAVTGPSTSYQLTNGRFDTDDESSLYPYIRVVDIVYADVTRDRREEAIVSLDATGGGTQHWGAVQVFSCADGAMQRIAAFATADRGNEGLIRAYAAGHRLVIELNDPARMTADCCSDGFVRQAFRWNGRVFREIGKPKRGDLGRHVGR